MSKPATKPYVAESRGLINKRERRGAQMFAHSRRSVIRAGASVRDGGVLTDRLVLFDPIIGLLLGGRDLGMVHPRSEMGDSVFAGLVSAGLS